MTPQQKKIIIDELHASTLRTTSAAIEVNRCAHAMKRILAKGDAQVTTGKDFRQKVKDELTKDLPGIATMLMAGRYRQRHAYTA